MTIFERCIMSYYTFTIQKQHKTDVDTGSFWHSHTEFKQTYLDLPKYLNWQKVLTEES